MDRLCRVVNLSGSGSASAMNAHAAFSLTIMSIFGRAVSHMRERTNPKGGQYNKNVGKATSM